MKKIRLDLILVSRGYAESRSQAQRQVMAGQVRVNGQVALKPGMVVPTDSNIELHKGPAFISRGGEKLAAAFDAFNLDVTGKTCADVGASTGGFTDCLLQRGATRIYAIDVGRGILSWKLRQDPRVVVMEGVNARYLESLPESPHLISIDVSFISIKRILPVVKKWFSPSLLSPCSPLTSTTSDRAEGLGGRGEVLALIKPQFEAGRSEAARGAGVIRDPGVHRRVLTDILSFAEQQGYGLRGLLRSPLLGPKGNVEFLVWMVFPAEKEADIEQLIMSVVNT